MIFLVNVTGDGMKKKTVALIAVGVGIIIIFGALAGFVSIPHVISFGSFTKIAYTLIAELLQ